MIYALVRTELRNNTRHVTVDRPPQQPVDVEELALAGHVALDVLERGAKERAAVPYRSLHGFGRGHLPRRAFLLIGSQREGEEGRHI